MVMSQGHEILPGIVALFLAAAAAAAAGRPRESVVERGDRIHNSGHGDHNVERDMQNISALLHWVNLMKPHSFLSLLMQSEHGGGGDTFSLDCKNFLLNQKSGRQISVIFLKGQSAL